MLKLKDAGHSPGERCCERPCSCIQSLLASCCQGCPAERPARGEAQSPCFGKSETLVGFSTAEFCLSAPGSLYGSLVGFAKEILPDPSSCCACKHQCGDDGLRMSTWTNKMLIRLGDSIEPKCLGILGIILRLIKLMAQSRACKNIHKHKQCQSFCRVLVIVMCRPCRDVPMNQLSPRRVHAVVLLVAVQRCSFLFGAVGPVP